MAMASLNKAVAVEFWGSLNKAVVFLFASLNKAVGFLVALASLNKAVGFFLASLNKADRKQSSLKKARGTGSSLKKAMVLAGLFCVQPAMAAAGLPWWRIRFHQWHKCYVLLDETGHQWRPLSESEEESLKWQLQLSPAMARYLLESGWQVRDLQKPYWSPKGQCWQLEQSEFPADYVAVGARPKARSRRAASRAASSNRAKSSNRAQSSNRKEISWHSGVPK